MTTLDFRDSEPTLASSTAEGKTTFAGNATFYERLQGQTKKKGIERYGWVALPVAAVAIIGIVAATSTPNRSADNIAAGPVDAKPVIASTTPAPKPMTPAQIYSEVAAAPADQPAKAAPAPVRTAQSAPAPVHLARRAAPPAPSGNDAITRPASASQPQSVPAASVMAPAPAPAAPVIATPAPAVEAPTPSVSAPPAEAAPAPIVTAPAQSAPAPADAGPAQ